MSTLGDLLTAIFGPERTPGIPAAPIPGREIPVGEILRTEPLRTEAGRQSETRGVATTSRSTKELRDAIEAEIRSRSVFSARVTNAVFVSMIKKVVTAVAEGEMDEATARWVLLETLRALGYTPEEGFPDAPPGTVPPAVRGSLQDLLSKRRLDLIIRTQVDLIRGAAEKARGMTPESLRAWPAWELVRVAYSRVPRDWPARWDIAGGPRQESGRLIAFKGDPVWGELGASGNFNDALDVDFPPFAFNSGMAWEAVSWSDCNRLGIVGPGGETLDEWQAQPRPVLGGVQPPVIPEPRISVGKIDPEIRRRLEKETGIVIAEDVATTADGREELLAELERRRLARAARREERMRRALER